MVSGRFGEVGHAQLLRRRSQPSPAGHPDRARCRCRVRRRAGARRRRSTTWSPRSSASRPSSIPTARSVSNLGREREGSRHRHRRERARAHHRLSDGRGACRRDRHQRRPHLAGDRRRLRPRDRLRPAAHARAAEDQAACLRQVRRASRSSDPALVASFGGAGMVLPVHVASRREFAGSWEYLVEGAIFTAPPHPAWSGAALISREGKLVGVGSLIVGDATGEQRADAPATCSCRSTC